MTRLYKLTAFRRCVVDYGPRRYRIIWLDRFETGEPYYKYTQPHGWCHLNSRSMFKSYSFNRKTAKDGTTLVSAVKLYLAVLPGFETMTEDDPLYGESMLGIDIGPDGRLMHVNNRWNHAHDNVDERKGDNKYSERELSELLGAPFYRLCRPFTRKDYARIESEMRRKRIDSNRECTSWAREAATSIARAASRRKCAATYGTEVIGDTEYRTLTEAGTTWMLDPVSGIPARNYLDRETMAGDRDKIESGWKEHDRELSSTVMVSRYVTKLDYTDIGEVNRDLHEVANYITDDIDVDCECDNEASFSLPGYESLVAVKLGDGRYGLYSRQEVALMSDQASSAPTADRSYADSCREYREWRSSRVADGGHSGIPKVERPQLYEVDGAVGVMEEDWSALEIASPLGFAQSVAPRIPVGSQVAVVDDVSVPGKMLVKYREKDLETMIPDGWRLPTLDEFLSLALRHGADVRFGGYGCLGGIRFKNGGDGSRVPVEPGKASRETAERLYEGFVDGKMERKWVLPPDDVPDMTVDPVDSDDTLETSGAEEYGMAIDRDVPKLSLRLPTVGFDMGKAGFAVPGKAKCEYGNADRKTKCNPWLASDTFTTRMLLAIPGRKFATAELLSRAFHSSNYVYLTEEDTEPEEGDTERREERRDRPLYAKAELDAESGRFTVSPLSSGENPGGYYLLYCVKK